MTAFISRARFEESPPKRTTAEYARHQIVADLFGERKDRGYLFRVTEARTRMVTALVLSSVPPVQAPAPMWGRIVQIESKPFVLGVDAGTALDFEILVNATRVRTLGNRKVRMDIWDREFAEDRNTSASPSTVYRAYLARKLSGAASVVDSAVTERRMVQAARGDRAGMISFVATNVAGRLVVEDPGALQALMIHGIGRSKAFGCGLLCLSRPGTVLRTRG